jgi:hypothetical protein
MPGPGIWGCCDMVGITDPSAAHLEHGGEVGVDFPVKRFANVPIHAVQFLPLFPHCGRSDVLPTVRETRARSGCR